MARTDAALRSEALEAAKGILLKAIPEIGLVPAKTTTITREVIRAYLLEMKHLNSQGRFRNDHSIAPGTKALMALSPGQSDFFSGTSRSALYSRMDTARKLLANPRARWTIKQAEGDQLEVLRLPDGATRQYNHTNKRAAWLASIPVGQSEILPPELFSTYPHPTTKHAARLMLNSPIADWSLKAVMHEGRRKYRITRTT